MPETQVEPCRACAGRDFDLINKGGSLYRRCRACFKKNRKKYRDKNREKVRERSRQEVERVQKLQIPRNPDGPTEITSRWYHHHVALVHSRVVNGESFVVTHLGIPIYTMVPIGGGDVRGN